MWSCVHTVPCKPLEYCGEIRNGQHYGLNKMYLLMEKQRNRGQDGAGLANVKLDMEPGTRYISRYRSVDTNAIGDIFGKVQKRIADVGSFLNLLRMCLGWKKNCLLLARYSWVTCATVPTEGTRLKLVTRFCVRTTGQREI